jgi:hypothetical protein
MTPKRHTSRVPRKALLKKTPDGPPAGLDIRRNGRPGRSLSTAYTAVSVEIAALPPAEEEGVEKPHRCLWLAEESRGETASGIGKNAAWQTPTHQETVKSA